MDTDKKISGELALDVQALIVPGESYLCSSVSLCGFDVSFFG